MCIPVYLGDPEMLSSLEIFLLIMVSPLGTACHTLIASHLFSPDCCDLVGSRPFEACWTCASPRPLWDLESSGFVLRALNSSSCVLSIFLLCSFWCKDFILTCVSTHILRGCRLACDLSGPSETWTIPVSGRCLNDWLLACQDSGLSCTFLAFQVPNSRHLLMLCCY